MAVDIFIKIGDIKGESMDKAHKDEIDVLNWSWGMAQSGNMHVGGCRRSREAISVTTKAAPRTDCERNKVPDP